MSETITIYSMSYLALARKYRPQTFDELVGQEFVSTSLKNAIGLGRVAHAYLFTGARGVGKTSAARIFAKALNCLAPEGNNPCNKCENCLEITAGTSIDVIEIDGASNRGIDEIRQLREAVKFIPVKYKYKVYIIDEVHMLTEQASNALLKTLEEPPSYVVFIFATTDAHKVIGTILSRCQRYDFKKIGFDDMSSSLKQIFERENISYDPNALNIITRHSEGCMRDALSISDQIISYTAGNITYEAVAQIMGATEDPAVAELFESVLAENIPAADPLIRTIAEKGLSFLNVTEKLITHTRNLLLLISGAKEIAKELINEELDYYRKSAKNASAERLFALFQLFQKLHNEIKYSSFPRYTFEFGIYKAASLSKIIPLPEPQPASGDVPKKPEQNQAAAVQTPSDAVIRSAAKSPVKTDAPLSGKTGANILNTKEEISSSNVLNNEEKKWHEFLNDLKSEAPGLASSLIYGTLEEISEDSLRICFPEERKFQYTRAIRDENIAALTNFARRKLGTNVKVEVSGSGDSNGKSLHKKKSELETLYERQIKEETAAMPAVKYMIDTFNLDIKNFKVVRKNETEEPNNE